jgi:hypothetical protein
MPSTNCKNLKEKFGVDNEAEHCEFKPAEDCIKYTRALKKIWEEHATIRENLGLKTLNVQTSKVVNSEKINNESTDILIKTNFVTDEKLVEFQRQSSEMIERSKNCFTGFRCILLDAKVVDFRNLYAQQNEQVYKYFHHKFTFYKDRFTREKKRIAETRYGDSEDAEDLSSEEEIILDSDQFCHREKTLKTSSSSTTRFNNKGQLRINANTSKLDSISDRCQKFKEEQGRPSRNFQIYKLKINPPRNSDLLTSKKVEYQFPFANKFEDIKELIPSVMVQYSYRFPEDFMAREKFQKYSFYFASRISRLFLEHEEMSALSVSNPMKLPFFVQPQTFNYRNDLNEILRFVKPSRQRSIYLVSKASPKISYLTKVEPPNDTANKSNKIPKRPLR